MTNQTTIVHTERISDPLGDFIQVWHLTPPAVGALFRVHHQTWDTSTTPPQRHIYRFEELPS